MPPPLAAENQRSVWFSAGGRGGQAIDTTQTIEWREGSAGTLASRFARVRGRVGDERPEEWLLIEWPEDEKEPTKYWLSTLASDMDFVELVDITKLRWRIERDYLELKQEVGLGHFEGRNISFCPE